MMNMIKIKEKIRMFDILFGTLIVVGIFFALQYLKNTRHCSHNCN